MSDLIRWEDNGYGGYQGYVGTRERRLFEVWHPAGDCWHLSSPLPGIAGRRISGADAGSLKGHAEELLREFVTSLGAAFPEPDADRPLTSRCECGGLARHKERCRRRQGYGSVVISDEREAGQ